MKKCDKSIVFYPQIYTNIVHKLTQIYTNCFNTLFIKRLPIYKIAKHFKLLNLFFALIRVNLWTNFVYLDNSLWLRCTHLSR